MAELENKLPELPGIGTFGSTNLYEGPQLPTGTTKDFVPTIADITANPELYRDFDFSTMDAGPLGESQGFRDWISNQDLGIKGLGGTALGAGQLGLGVLSYLENKDTADKQRQLMDQQLANNKYAMAKRKSDSASLAKAFGTA